MKLNQLLEEITTLNMMASNYVGTQRPDVPNSVLTVEPKTTKKKNTKTKKNISSTSKKKTIKKTTKKTTKKNTNIQQRPIIL